MKIKELSTSIDYNIFSCLAERQSFIMIACAFEKTKLSNTVHVEVFPSTTRIGLPQRRNLALCRARGGLQGQAPEHLVLLQLLVLSVSRRPFMLARQFTC